MSKKENTWELIKFLITGVVCAAADFLTTSLFLRICNGLPSALQSALSLLAGFIVGVILNYILSTYWVFRGKQDKKVTKSVSFIIFLSYLLPLSHYHHIVLYIYSFHLHLTRLINSTEMPPAKIVEYNKT